MSASDLYKELGVEKNASQEEITSAYKKLAKQHHPDSKTGNEEKFKKISNAYETLKDPEKRKMYDMTGSTDGGMGGQQWGNFSGDTDFFQNIFNFSGGGFSSFFSNREQPSKGRNITINQNITLEDLFYGKVIDITMESYVHCDGCKASGYTGKSSCSHCKGKGYTSSVFDLFNIRQPCEYCNQTGQTSKDKCKICAGEGRIKKKITHNLKIPKGVDVTKPLSYIGLGEAGVRSGKNQDLDGHLILVLSLDKHALFTPNGCDLHMDYNITLQSALLGTNVEIKTIDGSKQQLNIGPLTANKSITIPGCGLWVSNKVARRGNLIINIQVQLPTLKNDLQIIKFKEFINSLN